MKKKLTLLCLAWLSLCFTAFSQNCEQKFKDAEAAEKRGDYLDALRKFNASRKCDAVSDARCEEKIEAMFKKIEGLRKEAVNTRRETQSVLSQLKTEQEKTKRALNESEKAKREAQSALSQLKSEQDKTNLALNESEKAKREAQSALKLANNFINNLYFSYGRFALAIKNDTYFYMDKQGNELKKLRRWVRKPEDFDISEGFAKVENEKGANCLLDTFGNIYTLSNGIEGLSKSTEALKLLGEQLHEFPESVLEYPELKILILKNSQIHRDPSELEKFMEHCESSQLEDPSTYVFPPHFRQNPNFILPKDINKLSKLIYLNLASNGISALPDQIRDLKNLQTLNIQGNLMTTAYIAELRTAMPWCKIEFE